MWKVVYSDELYHHGIKGQKWGVRRFQNPDGTLTAAGKKRYGLKSYDGLPGGWQPQLKKNNAPYSNNPDDFILSKGSTTYRVSTNKDFDFKGRTYVSSEPMQYITNVVGINEPYIQKLRTKRKVIVAGKQTVDSILKDIGSVPLSNIQSYAIDSKEYDEAYKRNDFLYNNRNSEESKKFVNELKKRGYDALLDPLDSSIGTGYVESAMVFVSDMLEQIGSMSVDDYFYNEPVW